VQGKPYGLKDHVNQGLRVARPILEGRSIEPSSDGRSREMIDDLLRQITEPGLWLAFFYFFLFFAIGPNQSTLANPINPIFQMKNCCF